MTKFYTYFIATILMFLGDKVLSKGQPEEWQMGFQEAASPLMAELAGLHDFVFWIITFITVFVFVLLAYVCVKFSAKRNKTPRRQLIILYLKSLGLLFPFLYLWLLQYHLLNFSTNKTIFLI